MENVKVNRTLVPEIHAIDNISLLNLQKINLIEGVTCYILKDEQVDLCRIDWVIPAGLIYQAKKLQANMAMLMLKQGNAKYNDRELTVLLEFYGAKWNYTIETHYINMSLFAIKRHFLALLDVLYEMIHTSLFDQNELQIILDQEMQKYKVNVERNEWHADKYAATALYGQEHPYSNNLLISDFESISIEDVKNYYYDTIYYAHGDLFISGNIDDSILNQIKKIFSRLKIKKSYKIPYIPKQIAAQNIHHIKGPQSTQASIRMMMPIINKAHKDYMLVVIVNTILGGYFGSRLMRNLREDKGYTYGIYSQIVSLIDDAHWVVSTEVDNEVKADAIQQIYKEIRNLQTLQISEDELTKIKNTMLGQLLSNTDGVFNRIQSIIGLYKYGLDASQYSKWTTEINMITSKQVQSIANLYFDVNNIFEVIVY